MFINLEEIPQIIQTCFSMDEPNESILLYQGNLEIVQEISEQEVIENLGQTEIKVLGNGAIELLWFPYPYIHFNFSSINEKFDALKFEETLYLKIPDFSNLIKILVTSITHNTLNKASGKIIDPICDENKDLSYVSFNLINFHKFIGETIRINENLISKNRVEIEINTWKVTINQLGDIDKKVNIITQKGGFIITHLGKIERIDNQTFSANESREFIINNLIPFLSFSRGFSVPLVLLNGYDQNNQLIWRYWDSYFVDSWKSVESWFPTSQARILSEVLPGFLKWQQDWGQASNTILYSYLEANYSSTLEVKILLTQTALETLAWNLFVEKENIYTEKCFKSNNKFPASRKIRELILKFGIPTDLDPTASVAVKPSNQYEKLCEVFKPRLRPPLEKLVQTASQHNWNDGPHAFTEIRNEIVHAKPKYQGTISSEVMRDASNLGLWYLELVLLAMFGYRGNYTNRLIRPRQDGEMESVPWSTPSISSNIDLTR